jgi:phosphatidylglycerophosphate synthase
MSEIASQPLANQQLILDAEIEMSQIELTYKSLDTEETIDKIFYRPLGYYIALFSKKVGLSPSGITMVSIFFGVIAGHLFYYQNLTVNFIGICLLVFAETLDSADGQLARITNFYTRFGRMLDGFAGNVMFSSIYINLSLRLLNTGAGIWIFPIAIFSGISHSFQCAMADYYRNAYMYFVLSTKRNELDLSGEVAPRYHALSWSKNFFRKYLMMMYLNYTRQQEMLSKNFQELRKLVFEKYGENIPDWFKAEYRRLNKPLLKYYNVLTTNTRMIALFISIALDKVYLYFAFEIVALNLLLVIVTVVQERRNGFLVEMLRLRSLLRRAGSMTNSHAG